VTRMPTLLARPTGEQGTQLVEAGLIIVPFLAMAFLTMDTAWALFVKATLQHAVREGARYAVTGQVSGGLGQIASIKAKVADHSLGLLKDSQVSVRFLDPVSLNPTASNQGGNVVEVSVVNYQIAPLAPLLRAAPAVPVTVISADMMEGSPAGGAPAP